MIYDGMLKYKNVNGDVVEAQYKKHLRIAEVTNFIQSVVKSVVTDSGYYAPYLKKIAFDHAVIAAYTDVLKDVETHTKNREFTISEIEDLEATDILEELTKVIDMEQLLSIRENIEDCIAHEKGKTGIDRLLKMLLENGDEIADKIRELNNSGDLEKVLDTENNEQ